MGDIQKVSEHTKDGAAVATLTCAEDDASSLSRIFLLYLDPLFVKGSQVDLVHEDLGLVSKLDTSLALYEKFEVQWKIEMKKPEKTRSLWMALWRTVGFSRVFLATFLYASYAALSFGPILILNALTRHLEKITVLPTKVLWVLVALMFVLPMLGSLLYAQSNIIMAHIGVEFRNALVNMIYRKALRLSPGSRQEQSTGMIVNMFSNDSAQLNMFLYFLTNILIAPAQIAVALALIYQQVGPATFVGLAFMIATFPLSGLIFGMLNTYRREKMKVTDARVKLMNEILGGIRIIKYYAWELAFRDKVTEIRKKELIILKQMAYVVAIGFSFVLMAVPIVQPILIFFTYVKLGNQLDAAKAFTTIALFNLMQFPFAFLPMGLAQYSQSLVSTGRMLKFFSSDELEDYVDSSEGPNKSIISMSGVNMGWLAEGVDLDATGAGAGAGAAKSDKAVAPAGQASAESNKKPVGGNYVTVPTGEGDKDTADAVGTDAEVAAAAAVAEAEAAAAAAKLFRSQYTLVDINMSIQPGELVAIVGTVGSGKSSLLSALLGEMRHQSGKVHVAGSIAYCDQRPWILNATVQDNILFGLPYDQNRFDRAVHAASLEDDIKVLPGGVLTEIGKLFWCSFAGN